MLSPARHWNSGSVATARRVRSRPQSGPSHSTTSLGWSEIRDQAGSRVRGSVFVEWRVTIPLPLFGTVLLMNAVLARQLVHAFADLASNSLRTFQNRLAG